MALKLRKWDSAEHRKTGEDVVLYFEACLEVTRALGLKLHGGAAHA